MSSKPSFVLGFILGGVVAVGAVYALRGETSEGTYEREAAVAASNSASKNSARVAAQSDQRAPGAAPVPTAMEKSERQSTTGIGEDTQTDSVTGRTRRSGRGGPEEQDRRTSPTNLVQPIPVPEELRSVLEEVPGPDEEITMKKAHRLVSAQKKDDQWAWQMEQNFLEFFANHPLGSTIDLWLVECRTSFCEIQLASYGDGAQDNVGTLTRDMQSDPRVGGYTSQWASTSENNGILYFAHILNWDNLNP